MTDFNLRLLKQLEGKTIANIDHSKSEEIVTVGESFAITFTDGARFLIEAGNDYELGVEQLKSVKPNE